MKDQAEGIRWLAHAQDEYEDADTLRRMGRFYLALFHYQQAAEKALKAFLLSASGSAEVLRIPSVQDLIEAASEFSPEFSDVAEAKKLDVYYILTRYPSGLPGNIPSRFYTDPEEARQAGDLARAVLEMVQRKLACTGVQPPQCPPAGPQVSLISCRAGR
jgi:HEPN domain-containing protein